MKLPFVLSCGIQFHSCRWSNILIRKQSLGQLGSFPSSPALSYLLPSTREKRESTEVGELTCLSDSLLCSRIIFLQPAAYWLCDIFTKSDLATDLNAKWTLRPWTTFYLGVCLLLSNLRAMRNLKSPPHPAWPYRPLLTVALATERWAGRVGGGTTPVTNMWDNQSVSWYPGMALYTERLSIIK